MGTIAAEFSRAGRREIIPNLLGLSAGQAAVLCVFANIIRDFDLTGAAFADISDVRGIVIIDEADLHLHVDLQHRVLPQLMRLFPRIQFIVTAHSPLLVMGMEMAFGDAFRVIEMPSGVVIESETFSEFARALDAFTKTRAFDQRLVDRIREAARPVVIVEGKSDALHLQTAWGKLHSGAHLPWEVVPCGAYSTSEGKGGAKMLRTLVHACCLHVDRPLLSLFDHDREGVEQHESLKADGFQEAADAGHLTHPSKPVHSLLVPVPSGRERFVSAKAKSCFFSIEHLYADSVLTRFGVADDPVVADSAVYGITTDSKKKSRFAEAIKSIDKAEFANFTLLFDRLSQILGAPEDAWLSADEPPPVSLEVGGNTITESPNAVVTSDFGLAMPLWTPEPPVQPAGGRLVDKPPS